jgi:hypothetical protein
MPLYRVERLTRRTPGHNVLDASGAHWRGAERLGNLPTPSDSSPLRRGQCELMDGSKDFAPGSAVPPGRFVSHDRYPHLKMWAITIGSRWDRAAAADCHGASSLLGWERGKVTIRVIREIRSEKFSAEGLGRSEMVARAISSLYAESV